MKISQNRTNYTGTFFKILKPYSTIMHIRSGLILDRILPANIQKGFPLTSNNHLKNNSGAQAQRIELEWSPTNKGYGKRSSADSFSLSRGEASGCCFTLPLVKAVLPEAKKLVSECINTGFSQSCHQNVMAHSVKTLGRG